MFPDKPEENTPKFPPDDTPSQEQGVPNPFFEEYDRQFGTSFWDQPRQDNGDFMRRWNDEFGPKQLPNAQVIPDEEWDYKTATTDKAGNPLAYGAEGFDPYGRAYYGSGFEGFYKGIISRLNDPKVKNVDFTKPYSNAGELAGNIAQNVEGASDVFGKDSPLTPALRYISEGIGGVFTAMQLPAQWIEQAGGTIGLLASDQMGMLTENRDLTLDEALQASRITYSTLFDTAKRTQFIDRLRAGENPDFLAMELENPWAELAGQAILDPLNVLGMAAKGKKAALLLEKTGQKLVRTGAMGSQEIARLTDVVTDAAQKLDKLDDVKALEGFTQISDAVDVALEAAKTGQLSYKPGFFSRLVSAERAVQNMTVSRHYQMLVDEMHRLGANADEIGDALYHSAMIASDDAGQRAVGLAYALKHHPVPRMALAEEGLQSANVLWKAAGADPEGFLSALQKAGSEGVEGVVDFMTKKIDDVTKEMYPSVTEMREASSEVQKLGAKATPRQANLAKKYDELSMGTKYAERLANGKIPGTNFGPAETYRKIQGTLIGVYLSSPGYVMRNMINNTFTALVDQGARTFFGREGVVLGKGSGEYGKMFVFGRAAQNLDEMAGSAISKTIGGLGQSGDVAKEGLEITKLVPKAADVGEKGMRIAVMRASMQDSLEKLLQPGKFLPDPAPLLAAGLSEQQVKQFTRYFLDANGDADKALMMFKNAGRTGVVDAWRDTSQMFSLKMRKFLGKSTMLDEITAAAHAEYGSADEAVDGIVGHIRRALQDEAKKLPDDMVTVAKDNPAAAVANNITAAQADGLLPPGTSERFGAMVQAGREFEQYTQRTSNMLNLYATASDETVEMSMQALEKLQGVGSTVAAQADAITNKAWELTNLNKQGKLSGTPRELFAKYLPGIPPTDSKQDFLNALWKDRHAQVDQIWRAYYDGLYNHVNDIYKGLSKSITDPRYQANAEALLKNTERLYGQYSGLRDAVHDGKRLLTVDPLAGKTGRDFVTGLANLHGVPTATESGANIEKSLLKIINDNSGQVFNSIDEVPDNIAEQALEQWRVANGRPEISRGGNALAPSYAGNMPTNPRLASESIRGVEPELQRMEQFIRDNWGETTGTYGPEMDEALQAYVNAAKPLIFEARSTALKVANAAGDFTLLDYAGGKRGFDAALAYVMPFEFWPSRTYANWMQRAVTDPQVLANYARYKTTMEKINADQPDFYKYNVPLNSLLGVDPENPMYFNLEQSIWPLYGLTGVDFNDPYKRVDWWTSTLDDMGKVGPGIATPITAMTALALYARGEKEAASRWAGRLFPATAQAKSLLALGNIRLPDTPFTKGNEIDPFVNFFSGGYDPYERRRIGGAGLQRLVDLGEITQEQAIDAAYKQSGPIWEKAETLATKQRASASLASWGLGVGWKGRTPTDIKIDKFHQEYSVLTKQIKGGSLSPDATKQAFDALREKYPEMDLIILSKKFDSDRDRAYAYNVLGRLPPTSQIAEASGISDSLIQKFYDDKGNVGAWGETDRLKFMASVTDMSAVLAIPDSATVGDWNRAREINRSVGENIKRLLGPDIQDKVDAFFAIGSETARQQDMQDNYLKLHPEVRTAMDMRNAAVANIPELNAYYGGIQAIEKYYTGQMYAEIKKQLGEDIFDKFDEYGTLKLTDEAGARAFYRANPQLKQYSQIKEQWQNFINLRVARLGSMLRDGAPAQLRGTEPTTTGQQAITEALTPAPQQTWQEWSTLMGEPLQNIVLDYFEGDEGLKPAAINRLERLARDYGYGDVNELLQVMGASLYQMQP